MELGSKQAMSQDQIPLKKTDKDYGTPVVGSKTEARGKLAHERVSREILELCCVIEENGRCGSNSILFSYFFFQPGKFQCYGYKCTGTAEVAYFQDHGQAN